MPIERHRSRFLAALRIGLGLVAAVALLAGVPPRVHAHAELVASDPPAGAVLTSPPAELSLSFSEPIDPGTVTINLLDAEQRPVEGLGPPRVTDDGVAARVTLPDLTPGTYTISYQVVSTLDGHATAGTLAILVDPDGTGTPPTTGASSSSPSVDPASIAARWVGLTGILVALGSLVSWWYAGRPALALSEPARQGAPWNLITAASAMAFVGTALYLVLAARPILPPASVPSLDPAAAYGWTPFAIAMRVALIGTFAVAVLGLLRAGLPGGVARSSGLAATAGVMLAVALGGMSAAGHAAAIGGPIAWGVDWLHMLAVGAWLGGLPALIVLARRAAGPPGSVRSAGMAMLKRHGRMAVVAGPVAVLTGIAASRLVIGEPRDLVASDYGNLLIGKAILVSVALGIGAVNHVALRGRGRARIGALVVVELVVAVLAVAAAATMVTIQPAASRQPVVVSAPLRPAHLFANIGPVSVHASLSYPVPASQTWLVSVADRQTGGPRDDVQAVWLELTPPDESGLPPAGRVPLEPTDEPGIYRVEGAHTPVEGRWTVDLVVRRQGVLDERATFEVAIATPPPPERARPADSGLDVPPPLAVLWPLLPSGPIAWALAAAILVAVWAVARSGLGRTARRTGGVVLAAMFVVVVGGAGSRDLIAMANAAPAADEGSAPQLDSAAAARGEPLYLANCASCHGRDGDGNGPIRTLPAAGPMAEAVARLSAQELEYRIANGMAGMPMPPFVGTLSEAERWDLVAYLRQQFAE